ncbi:MAG: transposase [Litorimonas sp.]
MGRLMARRSKRLWTDEEKRSICFQTAAPGVSVAQVARRYAMNANMVFKWLRDPRYAPDAGAVVDERAMDAACFLPVEIIGRTESGDADFLADPVPAAGSIEIDIAGGHRLRITGTYDPDALARLIRGLSG